MFKIEKFDGEIKGLKGRGRPLKEETLAILNAMQESAKTGSNMRWPGAAADGAYDKNGDTLRRLGHRYGYHVNVGLEGPDLTFRARLKEAAPETPPPTPVEPPNKTVTRTVTQPTKRAPAKKTATAKK